jgi:hypothetical protein
MCGRVKVPDNSGAVGVSEAEPLSVTNKQYFFFFFFFLVYFPFPTSQHKTNVQRQPPPVVKNSVKSTKKITNNENKYKQPKETRPSAVQKKTGSSDVQKKKTKMLQTVRKRSNTKKAKPIKAYGPDAEDLWQRRRHRRRAVVELGARLDGLFLAGALALALGLLLDDHGLLAEIFFFFFPLQLGIFNKKIGW